MTLEQSAYASDVVEEDTSRKYLINEDLIEQMSMVVDGIIKSDPDSAKELIIYQTVKYFLKNPKLRSSTVSVAPAVFVYYLEIYKRYIPDLNEVESYNNACLSLFSLFPENYNDTTLRTLLIMSGESLNEVITQKLSLMKDLTVADILPSLTNVAVVAESIRKFTSTSYRKRNIDYILWIKDFMAKCLDDPKLEFMTTDPSIKEIVSQVTNGKKQIVV